MERHFIPSPERYLPHEGKMIEAWAFGKPKIKENNPLWQEFKKTGYLPYRKSMQLVEELTSSQESQSPSKKLAKDLLNNITKSLKVRPGSVRFYSAIGTPLDTFHGIDAILKIGKNSVTLDITADPEKLARQEGKADIIFPPLPDAVQEKEEYQKGLLDLIQQVKEKLEEKM